MSGLVRQEGRSESVSGCLPLVGCGFFVFVIGVVGFMMLALALRGLFA